MNKNHQVFTLIFFLVISLNACRIGTETEQEIKPEESEFPARFDWRDSGIITPIRDQGSFGSCGAFAAVGVFEALIKKETGITVDLSEQHIINCSPDWKSSGISAVNALKFMKENGIVLEKNLPYQEAKTDDIPDHQFDYKLNEYYSVVVDQKPLAERIRMFKEAIYKYGPVATNFVAHEDYDRYESGVYVYDGRSRELGGHWLLVVGWVDDNGIKNGGYWICKNSDRPSWGENGYFRIAYGECGIDDLWFCYAVYNPEYKLKKLTIHLSHDVSPRWSPDGETMAFVSGRSGRRRIWIMPSEGGTASQINTSVDGDYHIAWYPDGNSIVFDAYLHTGSICLWSVPVSGGSCSRLIPNINCIHPSWSPDGKKIAFLNLSVNNEDVWTYDVSTGSLKRITTHSATDYHPAWSPDGSKIAFSSNRSGNWDIWIIPASGGIPIQLTNDPGWDDYAYWSPDCEHVVFHSNREGNNDIWIISSTGGSARQITKHLADDWGPCWSPDGSKIAFTSDRSGNRDVWVIELK